MKVLAAVILLAVAAPAPAQMQGMIAWWDRPMRRDLGLGEDQNRQIDGILRDHRTELVRLRGAVEAAETALKEAMDAPALDVRQANEAIEKVVAARSDLTRSLSQMGLKMRQVLTPAQWQELQKRQSPEWRRRMMRPGPFSRPGPGGPPGGPGGPPPP